MHLDLETEEIDETFFKTSKEQDGLKLLSDDSDDMVKF